MKYVWIALLISAALGVTGIGVGLWAYFGREPHNAEEGYTMFWNVLIGVALLILALLAAAVAGVLYFFATTHYS